MQIPNYLKIVLFSYKFFLCLFCHIFTWTVVISSLKLCTSNQITFFYLMLSSCVLSINEHLNNAQPGGAQFGMFALGAGWPCRHRFLAFNKVGTTESEKALSLSIVTSKTYALKASDEKQEGTLSLGTDDLKGPMECLLVVWVSHPVGPVQFKGITKNLSHLDPGK